MKLKTLLLVFLLFPVMRALPQDMALPDSLITIEHTYQYALSDPEKAQRIMDELKVRGTDPAWELDWCQGDLYYNTGKYRLASHYFERVAEYDPVKSNPQLLMGLLSTLMESYRMNNDPEKTVRTALRVIKLAEQIGEPAETGRAYMFMGVATYDQKHTALAEEYFTRAEKYLEQSGNPEYLYHFHLTRANLLAEAGESGKAFDDITRADGILREMEENGGIQPAPDDMIAYERGRLYALASEVLAKSGRKKEAAEYYAKFMASPCAADGRTKIYIVPYLLEMKDYQTAAGIAAERISTLESATDAAGEDLSAALRYMIHAHEMSGEPEKALPYSKQAASVSEEIRKRDLRNAALELAMIYDVQQKEIVIREQENALQQRNLLLFASALIILLALAAIFLTIRTIRRTKQQNLAMVRQIKEMQKVQERMAGLQEETVVRTEPAVAGASEKIPDGLPLPGLFAWIDNHIQKEKLYLNPDFSRDRAIELFSVKRSDFIQAMNEYSGGTFTDYTNSLRMDEALRLLDQSPEIKIETVAELSGFGSARSFYRQFKNKYDMSPDTYRKTSCAYKREEGMEPMT